MDRRKKPLRCVCCGWVIPPPTAPRSGRYRFIDGWVCIFCLTRFAGW